MAEAGKKPAGCAGLSISLFVGSYEWNGRAHRYGNRQSLAGPVFLAERDPQDLFAKGCLMDNLKNIFLERMPAAEMEENLVIEADAALSNRRNGSSKKSMLIEDRY